VVPQRRMARLRPEPSGVQACTLLRQFNQPEAEAIERDYASSGPTVAVYEAFKPLGEFWAETGSVPPRLMQAVPRDTQ
jgi:hypothetical protein